MAERIGILKWKNRSQVMILTLQNERIIQSLEETRNFKCLMLSGSVIVFNVEDEPYPHEHPKLSNLRLLKDEKDIGSIINCFENSTRENFETAIEVIDSMKFKKRICETYPDLCPSYRWMKKPLPHTTVKESDFSKKYSDFCDAIKQFQSFHHSIKWDANISTDRLEPSDEELAQLWMPQGFEENVADYYLARMLSARIAEQVAVEFYRKFYTKVVDVSIEQLRGSSHSWKDYDILAGANHPVDVKNARCPVKNKKRYVEFCVPKFKQDRMRTDVAICGVFSPYLILAHFKGKATISHDVNPIYLLGETTHPKIQCLEKRFRTDYFEIDICGKKSTGNQPVNVIPPWVFDYPEAFYDNQTRAKSKVRQIKTSSYPLETEFKAAKINPIPALVASKMPIPQEWTCVDEIQREFLKSLYAKTEETIELPDLYLSILSDFLARSRFPSVSSDEYSPRLYEPLLFFSEIQEHPLGIFDPLNIIHDLIRDLKILWEHRSDIPWSKIKSFKFNGLGLLTGRTITNRSITIMAYCGGWIEGKGKCGNSPLIIGKNLTCEKCGKLICEKCTYCSNVCAKEAEKNKKLQTIENWESSDIPEDLYVDDIPYEDI